MRKMLPCVTLFFLFLEVVNVTSLQGCATCTLMGCSSYSVIIGLIPQKKEFAEGEYLLEIQLDGTSFQCTFNVMALDQMGNWFKNGNNCKRGYDPVRVGPWMDGSNKIHIDISPNIREIKFILEKQNKKLIEKSFSPRYEKYYPNGPICGPECTQAVETIFVP